MHAEVSEELRRRGVIRSSNNPIGDLAEHLFCRDFGWKQAPSSKGDADATDARRSAITTTKLRRFRSKMSSTNSDSQDCRTRSPRRSLGRRMPTLRSDSCPSCSAVRFHRCEADPWRTSSRILPNVVLGRDKGVASAPFSGICHWVSCRPSSSRRSLTAGSQPGACYRAGGRPGRTAGRAMSESGIGRHRSTKRPIRCDVGFQV
jgi:hypothetical protein